MKTEIDPSELITFYDRHGGDYDLRVGNEFRAFIMDFLCDNGENCCKENRRFRLKSIEFDTREKAEWILKELKRMSNMTTGVSVGSYYTLAGCRAEPEDCEYGWVNLYPAYTYEYVDEHGMRFWGIHFPEPTLI